MEATSLTDFESFSKTTNDTRDEISKSVVKYPLTILNNALEG